MDSQAKPQTGSGLLYIPPTPDAEMIEQPYAGVICHVKDGDSMTIVYWDHNGSQHVARDVKLRGVGKEKETAEQAEAADKAGHYAMWPQNPELKAMRSGSKS